MPGFQLSNGVTSSSVVSFWVRFPHLDHPSPHSDHTLHVSKCSVNHSTFSKRVANSWYAAGFERVNLPINKLPRPKSHPTNSPKWSWTVSRENVAITITRCLGAPGPIDPLAQLQWEWSFRLSVPGHLTYTFWALSWVHLQRFGDYKFRAWLRSGHFALLFLYSSCLIICSF